MSIITEIPNLPDGLKHSAISLDGAGVPGYAWPLEEALKLVNWLADNTSYIILGGDLYLYISSKQVITTMRENWYYTPQKLITDHENSIAKASNLIRTFQTHPMHPEIIINFVLEQTAQTS